MAKKDKLYMSQYNDYYKGLITEYQSNLIKMYYDEDMSLSEIPNTLSISPQGVRDALKRAEHILEEYEQKLGLVKKTMGLNKFLEELEPQVNEDLKKEILKALELLDK